jgi:hypothetical protein
LSDPVKLAAATTTQRLINRLRAEIGSSTARTSNPELTATTDRAERELAAGRTASAYAIAQDAYTRLAREDGARPYAALGNTYASQQDVQAALTRLRAENSAQLDRATARIAEESKVAALDQVAQMSTPFAMGWSTYAEAVLMGLAPVLDSGEITSGNYANVAAAIAEQKASLDVFDVDAVEMAQSARNPAAKPTVDSGAVPFLSQYTNFLNRAAEANLTYYRTVLRRGTPSSTEGDGTPAYQWLAASAYKDENLRTPLDEQTIELEVQQAARAITYFVLGASLVADGQSFGIVGSGIGSDPNKASRPQLLANSISIASQNVINQTAALGTRNIDASPALWSSQWGRAAADNLAGTPRAAAGGVVALNELWYDVMWVSALRAAFGQ